MIPFQVDPRHAAVLRLGQASQGHVGRRAVMDTWIRAVIFDIDGTLIDSVDGHARAWREVLARHGVDVAYEKVRHEIGKGGDQLLRVFLPEEVVARDGEAIEAERLALFKSRYLPEVRPFPKVRDLFLRAHAQGLMVTLASSAKDEELARYKEIAGIADLVDESTSADDAARSKPDPDIFKAVLARLGGAVPTGEVVVVGDSPYDAEAAGRAGLQTLGVLCGGFSEDELRGAGCVAIYADPADLLSHFDDSLLGRVASP
jgi:HAD superfamily hydrolase (TIGR01509 family)